VQFVSGRSAKEIHKRTAMYWKRISVPTWIGQPHARGRAVPRYGRLARSSSPRSARIAACAVSSGLSGVFSLKISSDRVPA